MALFAANNRINGKRTEPDADREYTAAPLEDSASRRTTTDVSNFEQIRLPNCLNVMRSSWVVGQPICSPNGNLSLIPVRRKKETQHDDSHMRSPREYMSIGPNGWNAEPSTSESNPHQQ